MGPIMDEKLKEVRDWAKAKIASGAEPPWAWYQYMKLIETVGAILGGQESISPTGNLRQSAEHSEMHLRLVGSANQQDSAPPLSTEMPVRLPM
jgi:hypothetical protein